MSSLFFCPNCGHNLTYISNRRLKCYKCEKYFTENFICRCQRDSAFKYSAEIIAPNKVKCLFCGKEAQVPASLEPPYIDKYRGGTDSGGLGSWDGQVSGFQPSSRKPRPARKLEQRKSEQKIKETEEPEIDYVSEDKNHIVIRFPVHNNLNQIRCEIIDGVLEVRSLLVDFSEKFQLPDFPVEIEADFKNAILDIHLKRKKK
ncbi:MAG: hypothetical protein COT67_01755 [Candidatus Tagabacteria bacterium CG09_land_8_20_14_0_10_41_14]|uniref:SHSP domain-containing protein n=2 Tax=Candidatus Tagaibacteriota TaxID=1817918 RepID=A0A2H0WL87_9BACT|nr:MAG: hypothetical protein COT67_01755 [Candidatus Tagabacteria bacterium CG09_land_8_20_14_0_10_41_14]PJE72803.1 MAG: hypothetical protein COV00_03130 [Candidatus Tagabacteria bacterium CG10_big_fil_rev_8_21_14_0_10_40_13]